MEQYMVITICRDSEQHFHLFSTYEEAVRYIDEITIGYEVHGTGCQVYNFYKVEVMEYETSIEVINKYRKDNDEYHRVLAEKELLERREREFELYKDLKEKYEGKENKEKPNPKTNMFHGELEDN